MTSPAKTGTQAERKPAMCGLCQYHSKQLTQGVTEMLTFIARVIFYALILRDPKPAKFVPIRHKIWADDGSPINPIAEQAARSI